MKYVDEYRDAAAAQEYAAAIVRTATRPWTIMEICGGQTHTIVKYGIDELLPKAVTLVHGPGCPVCVTPVEFIDRSATDCGAARRHFLLIRRHAARARYDGRFVQRESPRRRCANRLFARGCC